MSPSMAKGLEPWLGEGCMDKGGRWPHHGISSQAWTNKMVNDCPEFTRPNWKAMSREASIFKQYECHLSFQLANSTYSPLDSPFAATDLNQKLLFHRTSSSLYPHPMCMCTWNRWHNHLNPNIKREAWSEQEDLTLINAHQLYGNKWAEIAKFLPGR